MFQEQELKNDIQDDEGKKGLKLYLALLSEVPKFQWREHLSA